MHNRQMQFIAASVIIFSSVLAGVTYIGTAHLESKTRKQCLEKDWPPEQHDAHVDFCMGYGYPMR